MIPSQPYSNSRLEIHLLGRFAIYIDGRFLSESDIQGRKARILLAFIAHQRHTQAVRDQLLEQFWPDLDQNAASSQLYKALHHIRKAFSGITEEADRWIEMKDNTIRLDPPGGLVTDLTRFELAARNGLRESSDASLEEAASIYTGDFLPVERYSEWASLPREHYRQLYLDVLTKLAQMYEEKGELSAAAETLRLSLEKEPTLETSHRSLMRIFALEGQPTRAYHQYDLCREVLKEELGMSPGPKTVQTLNDIRDGSLSGLPPRKRNMTANPGPTAPIIGRDQEIATASYRLEQLQQGIGGALYICGEAGVGKTRFVQELMLQSRRRKIPLFLGRTGDGGSQISYDPFINLFNDLLQKRPEFENEIPEEFGRLIPAYSGKGVPVPHADKLAAKGFLFAQIQRLFTQLTEHQPAVIILEDLHDAEQGTMELLSFLLRHRGELPLLYIITLRSEHEMKFSELPDGLQDLITNQIVLEPLTRNELIRLIHQETTELPGEAVDHIVHLSEGNPLYALEMLRFYAKEGLKQSLDNHEERKNVVSHPSPNPIPPSLHQIVEKKLNNLSPQAHHLLFMAAVIGRQVPYDLLASLWGDGSHTDDRELFRALEEVIRNGLLIEHGLDYTFRHTLVRESIYATISEARRRALHGLTAQKLILHSQEKDREPVEVIAHHSLRAGEPIRGAEYLIRAGEYAERAYAHEDALEKYHDVIRILEETDESSAAAMQSDVFERIGDVYRACGRLEQSYDAYEKSLSITESMSAGVGKQIELNRKLAVVAIFRLEIDRSERYLQRAFELAGEDDRTRARLLITKALHLWHQNRLEEAYQTAIKARKRALDANAAAEASQACEILAMTCLPLGRWNEGLEFEMERQVYGWSPEIVVATDAHLCLWEYHVSGDQPMQKARSFLEQVSSQASRIGDLRCVAVCHYALGTMHLWRGNRRQAVKELSSSLELHERVGSPAGMAYSLARKSVLHTLTGATELGWRAIQNGIDYAEEAAVRDHCLQRLYGVGIWNRLEADETEAAGELAIQSEELLAESGACGACALELYPWLSYYYFQTGDNGRAGECGDAIRDLAEQTGNPIGRAVAAMIRSTLSVTEQKDDLAEQERLNSFLLLDEAVPQTAYSPVAHYLFRMSELQDVLRAE